MKRSALCVTGKILVGIVLVFVTVAPMTGCGSDNEPDSPAVISTTYSIEDVEEAFRSAGIDLRRQQEGPWKVEDDGSYGGCGELHDANMRAVISVCRQSEAGLVLIKHFDNDGQFRNFSDPTAFAEYLNDDDVSQRDTTPLLLVRRGNVTLTYVGADRELVERIGEGLRNLE